jgi:hypothetical protein
VKVKFLLCDCKKWCEEFCQGSREKFRENVKKDARTSLAPFERVFGKVLENVKEC